MKAWIFLLFLLLPPYIFAIEGTDDNVVRDYYVELYKTQPYVPDFEKEFDNGSDRLDYKKLREYLNTKLEIERVLQMAGDEFYYGLSFSKLFAVDYVQNLENDLALRDSSDEVLLRLNSAIPNFNYNGDFTVGYVRSNILPAIRQHYWEALERDSSNQVIYEQIQENLEAVRHDIFQSEQALNISLSPEYQQQDFRIWISLTFSLLIAVLLCAFFIIIYRRSDGSLARLLLNDTGLQFITIFVLIIAIILFGILNILGGSELAAILSGISGYILGKGGSMLTEKRPEEKVTNPNIAKAEEAAAAPESDEQPDTAALQEEEPDPDEKYFLGQNV